MENSASLAINPGDVWLEHSEQTLEAFENLFTLENDRLRAFATLEERSVSGPRFYIALVSVLDTVAKLAKESSDAVLLTHTMALFRYRSRYLHETLDLVLDNLTPVIISFATVYKGLKTPAVDRAYKVADMFRSTSASHASVSALAQRLHQTGSLEVIDQFLQVLQPRALIAILREYALLSSATVAAAEAPVSASWALLLRYLHAGARVTAEEFEHLVSVAGGSDAPPTDQLSSLLWYSVRRLSLSLLLCSLVPIRCVQPTP
jgi:hypothetical protein